MPSARSGYAIVAVLLIAAAGAFLRAEQLKLTLSPVARPAPPQHFSPVCTDNPHCQTAAELRFTLRKAQTVELAIVDSSGDVVRSLTPAGGTAYPKGIVRKTWDGTTDAGGQAADGSYRLRVTLPEVGQDDHDPQPDRDRHQAADARRWSAVRARCRCATGRTAGSTCFW